MSKASEIQLATKLYSELADGGISTEPFVVTMKALCQHLGFTVDGVELGLILERIRQHPGFQTHNAALVENWREVFDGNTPPSDVEAVSFIQDLLASPLRELLFAHHILAGTTVTVADGTLDAITRHDPNTGAWTLHLTIRGRSQLFSNQQISDIGEGELVLLKPNADCHYQRHPDCERWDHHWILFQPRQQWLEWLSWPQLDENIFHLKLEKTQDRTCIGTLCEDIVNLVAERSPIEHELQINLLEQIILRCRKLIPQQTRHNLDPRINQACDYIRGNLAEGFSVEDVAAHCNLSPSHLSHLFKEQIGISPKRWRDDLRLLEARKLLADRQRSIASIAELVGYSDPMQFSRLFRKKTGCSPSEFRNLQTP